jgi:hypothetical protein
MMQANCRAFSSSCPLPLDRSGNTEVTEKAFKNKAVTPLPPLPQNQSLTHVCAYARAYECSLSSLSYSSSNKGNKVTDSQNQRVKSLPRVTLSGSAGNAPHG